MGSLRRAPGPEPAGRGVGPETEAARSPRGFLLTALYTPSLRPGRGGAKAKRPPGPGPPGSPPQGPVSPPPPQRHRRFSRGLFGPHRRPLALSRPLATLTQKMRLRNTSTVLEEVIPHCPMVPAVGCGPARRALGTRSPSEVAMATAPPHRELHGLRGVHRSPRRRREPQPQQAPRSYAQPPQSPQGPRAAP